MTTYRYRALDLDGRRIRGAVEATSRRAAQTTLLERGVSPTRLTERRSLLSLELTPRRVSTPELMHLSRQLAAFLRAGIPILEALSSLSEASENPFVAATLVDVADALREGESFAEALDAHPRVFPAVYRGMVRTSELTGNLDGVLDQLAGYLERDLEARRQLTSALTYPSVVLLTAIVTIVILASWVIPKFETFFDSFNATLPLPTRMLLWMTGFLGTWWWALMAVLGLAVIGGLASFRSARGRAVWDRVLLGLPVIGTTARYVIVERFCRTLGSMVHAGVTLPEAMAVAAAGTNNAVFVSALETARADLLGGEGIARPIAASGLFPSSVVQMVRAGEDTGTLDEQLVNAAAFFEQELRFKIKHLTSLFEPLVIVGVGLMVGFVALALVTAMYGIYAQVQ